MKRWDDWLYLLFWIGLCVKLRVWIELCVKLRVLVGLSVKLRVVDWVVRQAEGFGLGCVSS